MKFANAKLALEWFFETRATIGDPKSTFDSIIGRLSSHRPSISAATVYEMQREPWTQRVPVHPSGNVPIGYVTDDQCIALVDIEKLLTLLPMWKLEVLLVYVEKGTEAAIAKAYSMNRKHASVDDAEDFFWAAVEHFENLLEENDYLGSKEFVDGLCPALSEREYN